MTAARTGEVIGARVGEFDLEAKIWTVPAARMKAARIHRVPLCDRTAAIVAEAVAGKEPNALLWPISDKAMAAALRRMGEAEATVHGFRSAFRDWAGNETHHPREIAEQALAHALGNEVEAAYRRSDALEKRRGLMTDWARWCEPELQSNNVVKLR